MEETPKVVRFIYTRVLLASIVIGIAYGIISHFNPFIYVNALFLAVTIGLLVFLMNHTMKNGTMKSRSLYFIFGIIICFLAWLTSWATLFVIDTNEGFLTISTHPGKFIEYIIDYAHRNKLSVIRGSSKLRMDESIMAVLYLAELLVFLLPSLTAFRKIKF